MKTKYREKSRVILIDNELSREEKITAIGNLFDEVVKEMADKFNALCKELSESFQEAGEDIKGRAI